MPRIALATDTSTFQHFAALVSEYEQMLPANLRHSNFTAELASIERVYGPPNAAFVATIDGEPCGCVALTRLDPGTAVVKKMYVRPTARNRGVARALMQALEQEARRQGYRRLVLDTERNALPEAYNLYVSLGFSECGPYGDVDYATPTFMERRLK